MNYNPSPSDKDAPTLREWRQAPPWYRQGWKLGLVGAGLASLLSGYVIWRGSHDYQAVKAWRGRGLAEKARRAAAEGSSGEANRLIEQARLLAPTNSAVLRTVVDLGEPSEDPSALQALRQMVTLGVANESDEERLCRLAFDSGHPEMAPVEKIKAWAARPLEELGVGKLEPVARWLGSRGLEAQAETYVRRALTLASPDGPEHPRLNVGLGALLASRSTGSPSPARLQEAHDRWMAVARHGSARTAHQAEALQSVVSLLQSSDGIDRRTPETIAEVRKLLDERTTSAPTNHRMTFRLITAELDLLADPARRQAVAAKLVEEAAAEPTGRLALCRWLIQHDFSAEALRICESDGRAATDRDWFIARLDSLFGQRAWEEVTRTLETPGQPLPPVVQALFLFRNDQAAGRDESVLRRRREALTAAARTAEASNVLYAAGNLEHAGETDLAMSLYRQIQHHQEVGLSGLMGLVRCLNQHPEMIHELMEALAGVLAVSPQSLEARADFIYLRLLEGTSSAEDMAAAQQLVRESPQQLGFRITAGLAALRSGRATEALATINGDALPWEQVRPGWRAVYASVLAANGQDKKAQTLAGAISRAPLKPGERKLLHEYHLTGPR